MTLSMTKYSPFGDVRDIQTLVVTRGFRAVEKTFGKKAVSMCLRAHKAMKRGLATPDVTCFWEEYLWFYSEDSRTVVIYDLTRDGPTMIESGKAYAVYPSWDAFLMQTNSRDYGAVLPNSIGQFVFRGMVAACDGTSSGRWPLVGRVNELIGWLHLKYDWKELQFLGMSPTLQPDETIDLKIRTRRARRAQA